MNDDQRPNDPEMAKWRALYRETMDPGSVTCPTDDDLAGLAVNELSGQARNAIADHVANCRRCAETYRLLLDLHRQAPRARAPSVKSTWIPIAIAATLLLAVAVTLPLWRTTSPADSVRSTAAPEVVTPPANAFLDAAPPELRWHGGGGATGYRVRLHDADGDVLWETGSLSEPRVRLPADVSRLLARGRSYFWTVEVAGPVADSRLGPFWFQITQ